MRFVIEKLLLTDSGGAALWPNGPGPESCGEADGTSARAVLTRFIAEHPDVDVGSGATFKDGQAVIVARNGSRLYALRALPLHAVASRPAS